MSGSYVQVVRFVQRCTYNNAVACVNVWHFLCANSTSTPQNLCADWVTNLVPSWRPQVSNMIRFNSVEAHSLLPDQDQHGSLSIDLLGTNTFTQVALRTHAPVVIAGVITWRTAAAGRSSRGRTYLPGLQYDHADGINWHATVKTQMTTIANAIKNRYTPAGNPYAYELAVWSRVRGGQSPPYLITGALPVTSFTVQNYVATMGSRRGGRGI